MVRFVEHRFRYSVLLIGCLCLTSLSSNHLAFNIAQVCMGAATYNSSEPAKVWGVPVDYTPYEISLINWAVALGTALATFPFSSAYLKFGARTPFFVAGILSAIATAAVPLAASIGINALLALRFVQGVSFAADFAAVGALTSTWASIGQNGLFLSVLTSYSPLSSALTNVLGGAICETKYGYPLLFYLHAAAGGVCFTLWLVFYANKPQHSPHVTPHELEIIQRDKNEEEIHGAKKIPYKAIAKDIRVWSIWMSAFCELFSTNFLAAYEPYYLTNVLQYGAESTGTFSALTRIVQIPVRITCGEISDRLTVLGERTKLVLFNTITVAGAGVVYAAISFVPAHFPLVVVLGFALINMTSGAASGGFYKAAVLYTRQYSHFVISMCQFLKCAVLFVGPALVGVFVHDASSRTQWRPIFLITAAALMLATVMFCVFASAQPAPFTSSDYETRPKSANVYPMSTHDTALK